MDSKEKIFFIVGAQRCGTSFLANALDQHPEIRMAKPFFPEPKFFLNTEEFIKGKEFYLNKFFKDRSAQDILGEKSTSYIESKEAALKIKEMFSAAKIIVSLRNPVDRAISNYYFSKANNIETRSLEEVFLEKKSVDFNSNRFSVSPYDYLGRGEYLKHLKKYFEIFGRENIKVLIFEKMVRGEEWNSLFDFLQVKKINPDLKKINMGEKGEVDKKIIDYLKNYFKNSNEELQKFLGVDLSLWK